MNISSYFKGRNYNLGLVMIGVGAFWILDDLDILEFQDVLRLYTIPALFTYIGLTLISKDWIALGLASTALGLVVLLQNLNLLTVDVTGLLIPGFLIIAGVYVIFRPRKD